MMRAIPDEQDNNGLLDRAAEVPDGHGYPRPQLRRHSWTSLNGLWGFAFDELGRYAGPADVSWDKTIRVPFSPETAASGLNAEGYFRTVWYRRRFEQVPLERGKRLLLHFGA